MLKEYAENNGYPNLRYYVDDGYTGTNFNRPDFQRMMEDVENGIIETIVVKDMSRFGKKLYSGGSVCGTCSATASCQGDRRNR